jgi:hypothetical protein
MLIQIWLALHLKVNVKFGLIKISVEIILHIKKLHYNQQDLIKHIDMKINLLEYNKFKWLEILFI